MTTGLGPERSTVASWTSEPRFSELASHVWPPANSWSNCASKSASLVGSSSVGSSCAAEAERSYPSAPSVPGSSGSSVGGSSPEGSSPPSSVSGSSAGFSAGSSPVSAAPLLSPLEQSTARPAFSLPPAASRIVIDEPVSAVILPAFSLPSLVPSSSESLSRGLKPKRRSAPSLSPSRSVSFLRGFVCDGTRGSWRGRRGHDRASRRSSSCSGGTCAPSGRGACRGRACARAPGRRTARWRRPGG